MGRCTVIKYWRDLKPGDIWTTHGSFSEDPKESWTCISVHSATVHSTMYSYVVIMVESLHNQGLTIIQSRGRADWEVVTHD